MESNQELQHWGIKGQKWGIRRYQNPDGTLTEAGKKRYYYQNPDGSLTEEGKKHYMEAARKGKLNPKKLSDADLNMINQRFNREKTYAQNVADYQKSRFSYKLKEAVVTRIKGNGGNGGGGGGGKKGGGKKGIVSLLAMPIKKAFEDAFKPDTGKSGDNKSKKEDKKSPEVEKGMDYIKGYRPEKYTKEEREAHRRRGERFMEEARTSEDVMRERYRSSHPKDERHATAPMDNSPRSSRGLPSGGIYMDPDDYSIHSDATRYIITRDDSTNLKH